MKSENDIGKIACPFRGGTGINVLKKTFEWLDMVVFQSSRTVLSIHPVNSVVWVSTQFNRKHKQNFMKKELKINLIYRFELKIYVFFNCLVFKKN